MTGPLLIEEAPVDWAEDRSIVSALVDLVNAAYGPAEEGMWREGAVRVSSEELRGSLRRSEIVVARAGGRIVGCVRRHRVDGDAWSFGMLAAAPESRGLGIGRALISRVESDAAAVGAAAMQLELLVPVDGSQPSKTVLEGWYTRLGYRRTRTAPFESDHPELAGDLIVACEYQIWRKRLAPQDRP